MEMENITPDNRTETGYPEKSIKITLREFPQIGGGFRVDVEAQPPLPTIPEYIKLQAGKDPMLMAYLVMMNALSQFINMSKAKSTTETPSGIVLQ